MRVRTGIRAGYERPWGRLGGLAIAALGGV
jgi:hypothetical protein